MRPPSACPLQVFSLILGRLIPFLLLRPVIVPIKRLCPPQLLPLPEAAFVLFPPLPCFALSNVPMFPDLLFQRSNSFTSSLSSQVGGVGSSKSGNLISWGRRVGAAGHPTVQNGDFSLLAGQTESMAMVLITNKKTFMGTCGGQKIYKSHKLCHRSR